MVSPKAIWLDVDLAKRRYPPLFETYGLDPGKGQPDPLAAIVRQAVISDRLTSALTEWFFADPKYPGLLALVDLLDNDASRVALRSAIFKGDKKSIQELSITIDVSKLSPAYAIGLGTQRAAKGGLRILKEAWSTHPDSFPLALTIGSYLYEHRYEEADSEKAASALVGWCQTAVAIRPNNALGHYQLGLALSESGEEEAARTIKELRRATELAPRFAKAHGRLAFQLFRSSIPEHKSEAPIVARRAIEIDDEARLGHLVLYLHTLLRKKDYVEASREFEMLTKHFIEGNGIRNEHQESYEDAYVAGFLDSFGESASLINGLISGHNSYTAYRLFRERWRFLDRAGLADPEVPDQTSRYKAACAAVGACSGQALDAPQHLELPQIRKDALNWLGSSLVIWEQHATLPAVLGSSIVGLIGSTIGQGPFLTVSTLCNESSRKAADSSRIRETVHAGMNHWLSEPDLAAVREKAWLDKLPVEEKAKWQDLWARVRSLRDMTAQAESSKQLRVAK